MSNDTILRRLKRAAAEQRVQCAGDISPLHTAFADQSAVDVGDLTYVDRLAIGH